MGGADVAVGFGLRGLPGVVWGGAGLPGLVEALRELRGFPLETRTRVSVIGEMQETVSTVTRVPLGPQPAALFEVPAGFRVEKVAP